MKHLDLLAIDREHCNTKEALFEDFGWEQLEHTVFTDFPEQYVCLKEVLAYPITDYEKLQERQKIVQDFIASPNLVRDLLSLCQSSDDYKSSRRYQSSGNRLKDALVGTIPLFELPIQLYQILKNHPFSSETLCQFVAEIADTKKYDLLTEKLQGLLSSLPNNTLEISMEFMGGFKFHSAKIRSMENRKMHVAKPAFFKKKKEVPNPEEVFFGWNFMAEDNAMELKNAAISNLCGMLSQISLFIFTFFQDLKKQLLFYAASLQLHSYLCDHSFPICFPKMVQEKPFGIDAKGVYDLSFAMFLQSNERISEIVSNDIDCEDGRVLFITGPNQGGKTTFLRSIGIAQLMAQAGLFVPAQQYTAELFCGIVTHFPKEEDTDLENGKLAEELTRLREDIPLIVHGGLVLFNESFATTTTKEGVKIASDVILALEETNSTILFVTHLYELALEAKKYHAVNLRAAFHDQTRTYKIEKGEPHNQIFASDLLGML